MSSYLPTNKRLTKHSARKHLVQKLSDHAVPTTHIMQNTGHKNVQSVNNYSIISGILNNRNPNTHRTYAGQTASAIINSHT